MFKDFDEPPALQLAERAGFHDADEVAHLGLAFFIMGIEFLDVLHDLPEFRVRHAGRCFHNDGLRHLVGHNGSDACLSQVSVNRWRGFNCSGFAHCVKLLGYGWLVLLRENGLNACNFAAQRAEFAWLFQLSARLLQAEVKNLLAEFALS